MLAELFSLVQMMLYLTCELKVKGFNVLQYASKKGATRLLDEILRTPHVFMNPVTEQFDVTYLIPDSVPEPTSARLQKPLSCIELIVNNRYTDFASADRTYVRRGLLPNYLVKLLADA